MITTKEAEQMVQLIKDSRDDDEAAHSAEDSLREAVLREVVAGNPDAKRLAEVALSTSDIEFSRWCA